MSNTYGWGNAGTFAKTPKAEAGLVWDPVKRKWVPKGQQTQAAKAPVAPPTNPYTGQHQQSLDEILRLYREEPDYSNVPQWTPEQIDKNAEEWASHYLDLAAGPYKDLERDIPTIYNFSGKMANNFGQAVALVFSGAQPGQSTVSETDAQAYAEKNFGSKYAIGAAVQQLGTELMDRISSGFTEKMMEVKAKIADIYSRRPDLLEERRDYLIELAANAKEAADLAWDKRVEIAGGIEAILRTQATDWDKANAPAAAEEPNLIQMDDGWYTFQNGKLRLVKPKQGASGDAGDIIDRVNSALDVAQKKFAEFRAGNVSRPKAIKQVRAQMESAARIAEQNGDTALAKALRTAARNWVPSPVAPEAKESPWEYSVTSDRIVRVNTQTGKVDVQWEAPPKPEGAQIKTAANGEYVYVFSDGRKPVHTGVYAPKKDSSSSTPEAKGNPVAEARALVFERAQKMQAAETRYGEKEFTKQQVRKALEAQFTGMLQARGLTPPQIKKMFDNALAAAGY